MALIIDGARVTSTLSEKRRVAERYLGPSYGVRADVCPERGHHRFSQVVRVGITVGGCAFLAKWHDQVSPWPEKVRVFDVLKLRRDYRRTRDMIEDKLSRATRGQREAKERHEDFKQGELGPLLRWMMSNRNEGRFSALVRRPDLPS